MDLETFEPTQEDIDEFGDLAYDFAWANACSWYRQEEDQKNEVARVPAGIHFGDCHSLLHPVHSHYLVMKE